LIAMLLAKYLHLATSSSWRLSNLVALLRMSRLTHRDLPYWLDHPLVPLPGP
jgi:hypothetical protein